MRHAPYHHSDSSTRSVNIDINVDFNNSDQMAIMEAVKGLLLDNAMDALAQKLCR